MDEFLEAEKQQAARCDCEHVTAFCPLWDCSIWGKNRKLVVSKIRFLGLLWYLSTEFADRLRHAVKRKS